MAVLPLRLLPRALAALKSAAGDEPDVEAPPRSGAGSGVGAWAKHARALGVPVTDDMSRDDIIAAVDAL